MKKKTQGRSEPFSWSFRRKKDYSNLSSSAGLLRPMRADALIHPNLQISSNPMRADALIYPNLQGCSNPMRADALIYPNLQISSNPMRADALIYPNLQGCFNLMRADALIYPNLQISSNLMRAVRLRRDHPPIIMKKYITLFIGILLATNIFGDTPDTLWTKTYGGIYEDRGYSVRETKDNGYIIAGYTESFGAGTYDVYLIRTDRKGNTLWTKTYGNPNWNWALSIEQVQADGGFIISGATYPYDKLKCDAYILRTDSLGDTLWTKTYGFAYDDYGVSVRAVSYGGFIIAGYSSSLPADGEDVYIIRTDSLGDTLWTKIFGGIDKDYSSEVHECSDSGFVVVGFTNSFGAGGFDVYLLRMDKNGDTLWTKTYGGIENDWGRSVLQLSDGGFVITGATYSFGNGECDLYLIRTDANGKALWTKAYGGIGWDEGYSVQPAPDGFIITGVNELLNKSMFFVYIVRVDTSGDTLWTKSYGKIGDDEGYSIRQTQDGGFIITGITTSFGNGGYDVYLLRLNKEMWIEEEATVNNDSVLNRVINIKQELSFGSIKLIVNGGKLLTGENEISLKIYDSAGRLHSNLYRGVLSKGDYVFTPDIKTNGIYFVRLTAGDFTETKKLILIK